MRFKRPFGGRLLLVAGISLATLAATLPASAASPTWQLADGSVKAPPGAATFDFAAPDKAHLLFSDSPDLIGNKNGTTMTATFTVQGVNGTFTYGGQPSCGGTTSNVRLYFESIPPGTKFAFTNYWWSDTAFATLANGTSPLTLTAQVDPTLAQWGDWNGQPSSTNVDAFKAAAGNITAVGLSFGGGCFFENGVGTTDGSGTFTLDTFSVS